MPYSPERRLTSDKRLPHATALIAAAFNLTPADIRLSTFAEDTGEATDLVVSGSGLRIAVRIREPNQTAFKGEFTVRLSGSTSEFEKLRSGVVDYYFYAFAADDYNVGSYWLMNARAGMLDNMLGDKEGDGYAFAYFKINPAAVVATSELN